jgi:N-hydroxyarylamine O-acetyltransferase
MANHYVSTLPDSVFVNHLIVGRVVPGQRQTLFDRTLTRRGKAEEHRDIATAAEARDALEDTFGLSLPADAKVGKLLERLVARSASATT